MLTISDPYRGFKLEGMDAHLSMGLVLTPQEFAAQAMQTKQRPLFDTWALSAHMPDSVVRLLESNLVPRGAGHGLIESEQGVVYPIVNLQAAGLQVCRFGFCSASPTSRLRIGSGPCAAKAL